MTHWELMACADGWARAHGVKAALKPPTNEEFDEWISSGGKSH